MKRFKTHKKRNNLIIYLGLFLISIGLTIRYIYKNNLINNNTIVDYMINDNFGNLKKDLTDVDFILKYAMNINLKEDKIAFSKEDDVKDKLEVPKDDKEEVNDNKNDNDKQDVNKEELEKVVYIYNTHQEEKYKSTYLEAFNITPSVFMASKMLKEYLENLGIGVIVEENNVSEKLHSLNLKYSGSYKVSRIFMEEAVKKTPTLKYFIDLHRDSSVYDKTTTNINGESYAKVLFIVGLENKNYELNLQLANKLKEKIVNYDKSLFRSIYKKSGAGVNGIYNQDFNPNTMLIEVGGQYNNISEVNNTLQVLAKVISEYIKENQNE